MTKLSRFMKDESGVTVIEYGIIAALLSVAIVTVVTAVGTALIAVFTSVKSALV